MYFPVADDIMNFNQSDDDYDGPNVLRQGRASLGRSARYSTSFKYVNELKRDRLQDRVISSRYPYSGPRFLNDFISQGKVTPTEMSRYYSMIRGCPMHLLNIDRPVFEIGFDTDFGYSETVNQEISFDTWEGFSKIGWVEHHPYKQWCVVKQLADDTAYFVRNELDCVGYIGTVQHLNDADWYVATDKPAVFPEHSLARRCVFDLNVLPSLYAYSCRTGQDNDTNYGALKTESEYNWIRLTTADWRSYVYVQVTDYDCRNLAIKSEYYPGIDSFIGKKGYVYMADHCVPDLSYLDGYRFWWWMYNDINLHDNKKLEGYFTGSAVREERRRKEYVCKNVDLDVRPLFPDITLQGGTFSTLQEAYTSVNEIGKFAKTANDAKVSLDNYMEQPWIQSIIHYITSIASNIAQIVVEFEDFRQDPLSYIKKVSREMVSKFSFPELKISQAQAALVISAAYYLFDKSQIVSIGLFLYGFYVVLRDCYEDSKYAEIGSLLITLVSVGVLKATQLRPVSITLQSNTSLQSMIFAACSFLTLGFASKGVSASHDSIVRHLFNNTKDLFALSRGALSLSKCIEYVFDSVKIALDFVFGNSFAYSTLVKMAVTSKDLQEYIQYCLTVTPEDLAVKLTLDMESRLQWERICVLHKDLIKLFASGTPPTETHIGYNMYVRACTNYTKLCHEYEKIKHSLDHFRPEPFMVWIWGEPGTGKTWCRDQFVNNMYRWHSSVDPTVPDARKTGLLYVRNPADKFVSRYNGEFGLAYDDVGQNRQQDNPEFNEIMAFGSTNQVKLNMADLEEKGRLFSSKVVIMAANSKNVVANNLILKEDAFNRRRHIVIEIRRPKTSLDNESLATTKCDFSKVKLVLSDPISGEEIKNFPESENYGDNDIEFKAMFEWLAPRYVKHVIDQKQGIEEKQRALFAVLNGDSDPSIVEIPEKSRVYKDLDTEKYGKFQQIAYYIGKDEDLEIAIEGIRNCYSSNMEPSILMKEHLNEFCRSKGIEPFGDDEFKFLRDKAPGMIPGEVEQIQELWNQRIEVLKGRSKWLTLLKYSSAVVAGLSLYKLYQHFNKDNKDVFSVQSYTQEVRNPPNKGKVEIQGYSVEVRAPKGNRVVIQGKDELLAFEPQCSSLQSVNCNIMKSVAKFAKEKSPGVFSTVVGFNVCYNAWLIPRHFFGKEIGDCLVRVDREGLRREIVNIQKANIFTLWQDGRERDICLVRIPSFPHGRNHVKHFANRQQLGIVRNFDGTIVRWDNDTKSVVKAAVGMATRWDLPLSVDADGNELYYSTGYKYSFDTKTGDCGALLLSNDNSTKSRIFGMHFGYNNTEKKGMSQHICQEDVISLVSVAIPPIDQIDEEPPKVELQQAECPGTLIDENGVPYFEHFGYVRDAPLPPRDHGDLFRSPLYGEVYPPEKDLSVLSKWDSRLLEEHKGDPDILERGVIDFAYESKPWPEVELNIATEALKQEFNDFVDPIGKRCLTLDEAINGIWIDGQRLEYSEDINLKTAAGYGLPGTKREHFETKEIRNPITEKLEKIEHTIVNPKLQQQVDDMWDDWMQGKTHSIPWSHTLKIEALKLSKIPNGNTRTFCVASTALLLNVRRLFGAFTTAMKTNKITSFSCLGVDANSKDWNDLYDNLRSTGALGADMDFFKFDRTAVTWQLARKVCEAINAWYDDSVELQRARLIAFEDMIFAYGLINKHLTRKRRGNPSGNPLTTELNNSINYLMMCMVYLIIAKERSPKDYRIEAWKKNVNMKAYGDDIIYTLHPSCVQWFCFKRLGEIYSAFGVPVTPADKSDDGITLRPLSELTFLKRNFRPYDHPTVKWQSALSQTSIRSMIQFYRLKPNNGTMYDAVRTNCMESLIESHHWGEEFFTKHLNKINAWMKANSYPTIAVTYAELDEVYRQKLEN
ncbi:nonstructural protein [Hovenia dulcis-associated virus 1]|nr:nonstructural protein [Hovenia dulcis-associated virus 1]